ncbi:hypothetical protein T439DRAFT_353280 [Meredithblackwellia eburnea MCA 4105]
MSDSTLPPSGVGFAPSRTQVQQNGDTIVFTMWQGEHRVLQGTPSAPCAPAGDFDTQVQTVPNGTTTGGPTFTFTVTNISQPLYFYDGTGVQCLQGAVFCVNTDESSNTASCAAYKNAALSQGRDQGVTTSMRTNTPISTSSSTSSSPTSALATTTMANGTTSHATSTTSATTKGAAGIVRVPAWAGAVQPQQHDYSLGPVIGGIQYGPNTLRTETVSKYLNGLAQTDPSKATAAIHALTEEPATIEALILSFKQLVIVNKARVLHELLETHNKQERGRSISRTGNLETVAQDLFRPMTVCVRFPSRNLRQKEGKGA